MNEWMEENNNNLLPGIPITLGINYLLNITDSSNKIKKMRNSKHCDSLFGYVWISNELASCLMIQEIVITNIKRTIKPCILHKPSVSLDVFI